MKQGVQTSSGSIIVISDADLSTPIEELDILLMQLEEGFEIVIGSHGLRESDVLKSQPSYRKLMGRIFNLIVRIFVLNDISDTQCGFKVFARDAAQRVFSKSIVKGFCFDVEVLFIARKMGLGIKEVP